MILIRKPSSIIFSSLFKTLYTKIELVKSLCYLSKQSLHDGFLELPIELKTVSHTWETFFKKHLLRITK